MIATKQTQTWDYTESRYYHFNKKSIYVFNKNRYIKDLNLDVEDVKREMDLSRKYNPSRKWLDELDGLPITKMSHTLLFGFIGDSKISIMPEWCDVYSKESIENLIKNTCVGARSRIRKGEKRYVINEKLLFWLLKSVNVTIEEFNDYLGGERRTLEHKLKRNITCPKEYVQALADTFGVGINKISALATEQE